MKRRIPRESGENSASARTSAFFHTAKQLRRQKRFHPFMTQRLMELCQELFPDLHPVKEIQGLAGGRNDLVLFEFNGRKVLIEVFGTGSQVSRDLRILDKTTADVKIAVVIDKQIDPRVFEQFLRENPETTYPFLFASEIADPERVHEGRLKLHELVTGDEAHRFARFIRTLSKTAFTRFLSECRRDALVVLTKDDIRNGVVTFDKVFATIVIGKLRALGVTLATLKELATWMSKPRAIDFVLERVWLGLNMFLYSDLRENFGFYSDTELLDFVRIGSQTRTAYILLSMNSIILEIMDSYIKEKPADIPRNPRVRVGHSQIFESRNGRLVTFSLPRNTKKIVIFPPMVVGDKKGMTEAEVLRALEISGSGGAVRCGESPPKKLRSGTKTSTVRGE